MLAALLSLLWLAGVLCLLSAFGLLTLVAPLYVVGALAGRLALPYAGPSLIRTD